MFTEEVCETINETIEKWVNESKKKGGRPLFANEELFFRQGWQKFGNPISNNGKPELNEGLIKTYPSEQVEKFVREAYKLEDFQIEKVDKDGIVCFRFYLPLTDNNDEAITQAMDRLGYFLSNSEDKSFQHNRIWRVYQFEPKFQPDETELILEENKFLCHVTPFYNKEKILTNGLVPKSKNLKYDYPDRIYLFSENLGERRIIGYAVSIWKTESSRRDVDRTEGRYALFEVNTSKIGFNTVLHRDANLPGAVWTTNNIKPEAIRFVKEIGFESDENGYVHLKDDA